MNKRVLVWDGCNNVRDLGGLSTCDGHKTRWGAVVRSDSPARLTAAGWSALYAYGIRTIITLRTYGMTEDELNFTPRYPDLVTVQVAIEDITDMEFLQQWAASNLWGTPLYFKDALRRWPERHAAVISAIARAQPGGVLFHCIRGNDRTGIIALLLLALAGVTPDDIIADYELSIPDPERNELLAREHSSVRDAILSALAGFNIDGSLGVTVTEGGCGGVLRASPAKHPHRTAPPRQFPENHIDSYLSMGGVSQEDLAAVRKRLLG